MKTIVAGPNPAESKGVVLFVHGFPETAASWKEYILHYAAAGYHVLAPDMRNVNNSMAESGTLSFDLLSDDLLSLVTSTGHDKATAVFVFFMFWEALWSLLPLSSSPVSRLLWSDTTGAP